MRFVFSRIRATIGSTRALLRREAVLFLLVGGFNTILNYGFYLLCLLVFTYATSFTISYVSGLLTAYLLNSIFVFKEPMRLSSFLRYPIVYVVQYLLGVTLLYLLVELAHVSPFIAPWIIIIATTPITYFLSRYIIKRRIEVNSCNPTAKKGP